MAGESYRQHEHQAISKVRPGAGPTERLVMAQLAREPTNQHDRNAVHVDVGGVRSILALEMNGEPLPAIHP